MGCNKSFRLRKLAQSGLTANTITEREILLSFVVINILNTWSNFSRTYYLSCILKPRTITRRRITLSRSISSFDDAIGLAITDLRPQIAPPQSGVWHRRDEPAWHDRNLLIRFCTNIGCSNISDIQAAFSFGSRVFDDLPVLRNFYAHRNRQTENAVTNIGTQYGIPTALRPSQMLSANPLGRSQELILELIDDVTFTMELLCD